MVVWTDYCPRSLPPSLGGWVTSRMPFPPLSGGPYGRGWKERGKGMRTAGERFHQTAYQRTIRVYYIHSTLYRAGINSLTFVESLSRERKNKRRGTILRRRRRRDGGFVRAGSRRRRKKEGKSCQVSPILLPPAVCGEGSLDVKELTPQGTGGSLSFFSFLGERRCGRIASTDGNFLRNCLQRKKKL